MHIMKSPKVALQLLHDFGARWVSFRILHALKIRTGWLRRSMPVREWAEEPLGGFLEAQELAEPEAYWDYRQHRAPEFFFDSEKWGDGSALFDQWDAEGSSPVDLAERLREGRLQYFARLEADGGFPPDWHRNAFTGVRAPADIHWSEIGDFEFGDIKVIWEPNRFSFAYTLVRAYRRTGDERYPEMFWQLVEDWRSENPPQAGVNWKCGQEISFRVMAWIFGLYGFQESAATTAERVAALAQMVAVSGKRIEANLEYALSQRNNHGISEGVGLWTIGLLFPEIGESCRWLELGRQVLERSGEELIYADGSFAQHSVNYHRLMLHDSLWAIRLGDINGQPLSGGLRERVGNACRWLYGMQNEVSGRVPNYGQNDGALVLPLNNSDYRDFRPVLQAVHYLSTGTRCYPAGPWDEDLLWLFGRETLESAATHPERTPLEADQGGYYTLRSAEGFAFVRCASFVDRPAQADMLHVDLWWRGQNVALDAGTYSYNASSPWNNSLAHTAYHNTVTVDGLDQMDRVGKFLWLPWLKSKMTRLEYSGEEGLMCWEGEHDGYERLSDPVRHRRTVLQLPHEKWVVLDQLQAKGKHDYRLHWLLMDAPFDWDAKHARLILHTAAGPFYVHVGVSAAGEDSSLVRAEPTSARGWHSPYYHYREPAISLALSVNSSSCCFWSVLGPDADVSLEAVKGYKEVDSTFKRFSS
jgi:hypothetical protein